MAITLNAATGITNATWATGCRPASPITGQQGFNSTLGVTEVWNGSAWVATAGANVNNTFTGTNTFNGAAVLGSTLTANGSVGNSGQVLTSTGTGVKWACASGGSGGIYAIKYIVVAGGGAGGDCNRNGGGGAGGVLLGTAVAVQGTPMSVVVGAGGAGLGSSGGTSQFCTTAITATGGGRGAYCISGSAANGAPGGSGGGGGVGGAGTPGQGYPGGNGFSARGGGGGGAAGPGSSGGCSSVIPGAPGGPGINTSFGGLQVGGGGGGGSTWACGPGGTGGFGGGPGGTRNASGTPGTVNTGGGGGSKGAGVGTTGNGGSGVVLLQMATTNYTGITTGAPTVTTSGSNTILKFTSSGSYTP